MVMKNKMTIKFNQKEIGFSFGLGFIGELLEFLDISIGDLGSKMTKNPFKYTPIIMFFSAKYYAEDNNINLGMNQREFIDFLDNNGGIFSKQALSFQSKLTESFTKDVPNTDDSEEEKTDEPKKK